MERSQLNTPSTSKNGEPAGKRQRMRTSVDSVSLNLCMRDAPRERQQHPPNLPAVINPSNPQTSTPADPPASKQLNIRLNQIRKRMHNFCKAERLILEEREAGSKRIITDLQFYLTGALRAMQMARGAHTAAEFQRTELQQKNTELLTENAKLKEFIFQQTSAHTLQLNAAMSRITELQQNLNALSSSQGELNAGKVELEKTRERVQRLEAEKTSLWVQVQDLLPRAERAKELEEELVLADKIITNLRENVTGEKSAGGEASDGKKGDSPEVIDVEREESSPRLDGEVTIVSETVAVASDASGCDDEAAASNGADTSGEMPPGGESPSTSEGDAAVEPEEEEDAEPDRPIWVGEAYVLASHEKFFEIKWRSHYEQRGTHKFLCKKCKHTTTGRGTMEDHIWVNHYGGTFKCPSCINYALRSRYNIKRHMHTCH
ncbi:uncharacterized protein LOC107043085 [Diachasma alloeum]|uniref:uncharacterized protein LOC107043085 n=1 Tax=Diachasma alloeum TaxID=454923 RepID=UPI0007382508|nr:uncharacterized protein LOC107043085 [Diachasma alloeum]